MAIPSKQIGQSTTDNLLWNISKQLEALTKVTYNTGTVSPFNGDFLPALDDTYNLGSTTLRWKSLHLGEGTLYITDTVTGDEVAITVSNGVFFIDGVEQVQLPNIEVTNLTFNDASLQTTAYIPATTQTFDPGFTDLGGAIVGVTSQGHYTMLSPKVCFFRVKVFFDNCTNFGTTQYQFNLPFTSVETLRTGNATIHRRSDNVYFHIAGIADSTASLSIMKLYYSGSTTDLAWKNSTPVGATTTSSHFDISGVYEIA